MTAQTPDRLEYDGKTYRVYEFVDLPPGVTLPPAEILVRDTAHWRGYTARWEIREQDGRTQLYMVGFDCEDYLALYRPYLNPITGTVRVVPEDAKLLDYEHMGFQSKYKGELKFRFVAGELVGVEPIPDTHQPQDGLLDLAELGPGGKEGWSDQQRQLLNNHQPTPIPPDVKVMLEVDEFSSETNVSCSACGAVIAGAPDTARDPLCDGCTERLLAIGRHLKHWHAMTSKFGGAINLSQRLDRDDQAPLDPEWHTRTRLDPFGSLGFDGTDGVVRLRIRGRQSLQSRTFIDAAGDEKTQAKHLRSVLSAVSKTLEKSSPDRTTTEVSASYQSGIVANVRIDLIVTTATRRGNEPVLDAEIAAALIAKLEAQIERWHAELAAVGRTLHREVPALVQAMTPSTDACMNEGLAPTDREILNWMTHGRARRERVWAMLPRHTLEGWLPGETVAERYRKSLNL